MGGPDNTSGVSGTGDGVGSAPSNAIAYDGEKYCTEDAFSYQKRPYQMHPPRHEGKTPCIFEGKKIQLRRVGVRRAGWTAAVKMANDRSCRRLVKETNWIHYTKSVDLVKWIQFELRANLK